MTLADLKAFIADLPDDCQVTFVNSILCFTGDEACPTWSHEDKQVSGVIYDENANAILISHGDVFDKLVALRSIATASSVG